MEKIIDIYFHSKSVTGELLANILKLIAIYFHNKRVTGELLANIFKNSLVMYVTSQNVT